MDTTTPDEGAAPAAQPDVTPEAVTEGHNADQVITTDDNGTPTLEPTTSSQAQDASEAVSEAVQTQPEETQAGDDTIEWAKKKGLEVNPDNPNEVKLAQMQREAEKRMHEAAQRAKELETASVAQVPVDYTGDPGYDSLAQSVNTLLIQNKVRDFFADHPEAREFEPSMAEIVTARPHLQHDLDALYALARTDPNREAELRQAGGREALTNLAQKQQQIPPTAGATNSGVYESSTITPQNVYDLVDKNDQEWFEKNHTAISRAMSGK